MQTDFIKLNATDTDTLSATFVPQTYRRTSMFVKVKLNKTNTETAMLFSQ